MRIRRTGSSATRLAGLITVALSLLAASVATGIPAEAATTQADDGVNDAGTIIYVSSSSAGIVDGNSFASGDILSFDQEGDTWSVFFDSSAAGLGNANTDGFHIVDNNPDAAILLLSFSGPATVPGIGRVDDSDVVTFVGSTGAAPNGTFALTLDGSNVGLVSGGEDIDALTATGNEFAISVTGNAAVPATAGGNLSATDEDLILFSGSTSSSPTTGDFSTLFDGSDVGLRSDVVSAWIDPATGEFYGSALGPLTAPGLRTDGDDIFAFTGTTGDQTSGTFALFFDGDAHRFGGEQIDGLHIASAQPGSGGTADVAVVIDDDVGDGAVAGDTVTFDVSVTNNGPDTANNVVLTGAVAPGLELIASTGCEVSSAGLPCSLGSLEPTETAAVSLRSTVSDQALGLVTTTVSVSAGTADPEAANNTAAVETLISGPPTATPDGAATNSVPGDPYHGTLGGSISIAAPGLLANDVLGSPAGEIVSFGIAGDAGAVTDNPTGTAAAIGDGTLTVQADGSFAFDSPSGESGQFAFQYRLANEGGFSDATVSLYIGPRPTVAGGDLIYLSTAADGSVDGIEFADEDIVTYDTESDTWALFFDGSDVGLGTADIDGFTIETLEPQPVIHMSLTAPRRIAGVAGTADDSDVVTFTASSVGSTTAGSFELLIDGSDMNLSSGGEDVDAVAGTSENVLLSTVGSFNVGGGLTGGDEDLLGLDVSSSGAVTTGVLSRAFDGSDVALRAEDVSAASLVSATGELHLSILGDFSVPGLRGDGDDIVTFTPSGDTADPTVGTFSTFFDGDAHRFGGNQIDAAHVAVTVDEPPIPGGGVVDPTYGEGWHLDPPEVIFGADEQTATVRLINYGPDGEPTGAASPAGITLVRPDPLFTIDQPSEQPDQDILNVSGSDAIGSELVGVRIPGVEEPLLLWITSYRVQSDVVIVPQSDIVFPPPGEAVVDSVAPFTLAELEARFSEGSETANPTLPYIIRGTAPVVGTKLSGIDIYGQVVEPAGLPSLEHEGLVLVTLELIEVTEIFSQAAVDVDYQAIADAGLASVETTVAQSSLAQDDGGLSSAESNPIQALDETPNSACTASINAQVGQNDVAFTNNINPVGEFRGLVGTDPATNQAFLENLNFKAGLRGTASVIFQGNIQVAGAVGVSCDLFELPTFSVPIPGPWAAVFDLIIDLKLVGGASAKATATQFGFDYKAGCSVAIDSKAGVSYNVSAGWSAIDELAAPVINCADNTGIAGKTGGSAAELGISFSGSIVAEGGTRIGGKLTAALGRLLKRPNTGKFRPFVAKGGPSLGLTIENGENVIQNKAAKTGLALSLVGEAGLSSGDLDKALKVFGVTPNVPLPKVTFSSLLGNLLGPPTNGVLQVTNSAASIGETVEITSTTKPSFAGLDLDTAVYVYETTSGAPVLDTFLNFSVGGSGISADFEMTEELCQDKFNEKRSYRVLGYMGPVGPVKEAVPVYLGGFSLECDQDLQFEIVELNTSNLLFANYGPTEVVLNRGQSFVQVDVVQTGFDNQAWELIDIGAKGAPYVSIDPAAGVFASGSQRVNVTLDCGEDENQRHDTTFYQARVGGRLQPAKLTVKYDCSDNWIDVLQDIVTPGFSTEINSSGTDADRWVATTTSGKVPLHRVSGNLPEGERVSHFSTAYDPRGKPKCGEGHHSQVVRVTVDTEARGSDQFRVYLPERKPPSSAPGYDGEDEACNEEEDGGRDIDDDESQGPGDGPGGSSGDPHITSLEGLTYDAQVLGEYDYIVNADADPDSAIRVVARHERSVDGPTQAFAATSTTALSIELGSTKIEAYARTTSLEVRVNGNVVNLPYGRSVDAGDALLTLDGDGLTVDGSGIYLTVQLSRPADFVPHLNTWIYTDPATPLTGLLGSNDGDQANDLTGRDGTAITLAEARAHDAAFYGFTDSWRLFSLDDSPFTLPSPVFDDPNEPRPSSEVLAPYRAQALSQLGAATSICSGAADDDSYVVDVLAIELAIGMPASDLSQYTCDFAISGRVTTTLPDGSLLGVHGAQVAVDAEGLAPCTTTAAINGTYICRTSPDFDEVGDGSGISFPLPVTVNVSAPGGDSIIATSPASIATKPVFGTTAESEDNDVSVAPSDVTIVDLSGTLSLFGDPLTTSTNLDLIYQDDSGAELGSRQRTVIPAASGNYREAFVVPQDTAVVEVTWNRGLAEDVRPSTSLSGFSLGTNARTFDATYNPPVAAISGTALINGTAPLQVLVTIEAALGDGSTITREIVAEPDQDTGAYQASRALPNNTASFVATVEVHDQTLAANTATVDPAIAGSNPLTIDLAVDVPVLAVSGTALDNGVPVDELIVVTVDALRPGGETVSTPFELLPGNDGSFAFSAQLPVDATSATVTAAVGPSEADYPSLAISAIDPGVTPVPFDFDATYPVLSVTGTVTGGGVPFVDRFPFSLTTTTPAVIDDRWSVDPQSDGTFAFTYPLPAGTTAAELTAEVGFDTGDHVIRSLTGLVDGTNDITFDPAFDAVVVEASGTLTDRSVPVAGFATIEFDPLDSSGDHLGAQYPTVAVDDTGSYDTLVFLPANAVDLLVSARIDDQGAGRLYQRFDGLGSGLNTVVYNHDHNPPVLNLSGSFSANGQPESGVYEIVAEASYTNKDGFSETVFITEEVFLSIIDGSYSLDLVLPEATTSVMLTAQVGADPALYPMLTVDPVAPGPNPVDFSADQNEAVDVQLTVNLSVAGSPFSESTIIKYRVFDDVDLPIGDEQEVVVNPGTAGSDTVSLELSPDARRLDVAWVATAGPTFQSFDVAPGINLVDYTAELAAATLNVTGRLTDNGAPVTESTQIRVTARLSATGSAISNETVDVVPDSNGDYQFTVELPPTATAVDVRWLDALSSAASSFPVQPGVNDIVFDDDVGSYGTQSLELSGTITVGGDPWPLDFDIVLRPRRVSGSSFPVFNTVTPDPTTGAYTLTYNATQPITEIQIIAGPVDTVVPLEPDSPTVVDLDFELDVQLVNVSGSITDGTNPATSGVIVLADADEPENRYFYYPTFDANGGYEAQFEIDGDVTSAFVGVTTELFDNDVRFGTAQPISSGVTDLTDINLDIEAPAINISGTLTSDGAAVTDPVSFAITWIDDAPDIEAQWTSQQTATPDSNGDYSFNMTGPLRADRAVVVADIAAPLADRQIEIAPLANGDNAGTLSVDFNTAELVVSGTFLDRGQPADNGPYTLAVETADGTGANLGTLTAEVTPDGGDGSYSVTVAIPADAEQASLSYDLTDYDYETFDPNPALVFTTTTGTLDIDGSTDVTFDVATTFLELDGVVRTSDGDLRNNDVFDFSVESKAGAAVLATATGSDVFTGFTNASYSLGVYLPAGTDNAAFQANLAGAAIIDVTGISPGLNTRSADIITDPFNVLTIDGRLAVNGANAVGSSQIQLSIEGYRTTADAPGHQLQQIWSDSPNFGYTAADGTGAVTVQVPPEVEVVELVARLGPTLEPFRRTIDLRTGTSPFTLDVDLNSTDDLIQVFGMATVGASGASGPCSLAGDAFLFRAIITGYTGDPAEAGTPPGVTLVDTVVVTSLFPSFVDGAERNFDVTAPVPAGITHYEVAYDTAGVEDPSDALFSATRDAVAYSGGALKVADNLSATCS